MCLTAARNGGVILFTAVTGLLHFALSNEVRRHPGLCRHPDHDRGFEAAYAVVRRRIHSVLDAIGRSPPPKNHRLARGHAQKLLAQADPAELARKRTLMLRVANMILAMSLREALPLLDNWDGSSCVDATVIGTYAKGLAPTAPTAPSPPPTPTPPGTSAPPSTKTPRPRRPRPQPRGLAPRAAARRPSRSPRKPAPTSGSPSSTAPKPGSACTSGSATASKASAATPKDPLYERIEVAGTRRIRGIAAQTLPPASNWPTPTAASSPPGRTPSPSTAIDPTAALPAAARPSHWAPGPPRATSPSPETFLTSHR
ncbi:hypothetical protein [Streptomyces sp. NBC_01235]|uniref:hypothetical protein n=1 Tax=Streptomyces sp. NBC_01235 TaxID=2903788 RepID=UPI002E13751B|nr:hypothetical protein OG289_25855 [Streptomyces sp. NBC_01235]